MKQITLKILAITISIFVHQSSFAVTHVFTCEPEWASLLTELGGELVDANSATTAHENPHYIRAKPSLISEIRQAELVVCSGASLEIGWLPLLLQKAGGDQIRPGSNGYLMVSDFVSTLEKPNKIDRADGDVHPEGNPHLHLNPHNIATVASEIIRRLIVIDPGHRAAYEQRLQSFKQRWEIAVQRWEALAQSLRGRPIVVHHKSFSYLIDWLGMMEVGTLEPKPGIPPTATHLEELLRTLRTTPPIAIIRTAYEPSDASDWLAKKIARPAMALPYTIGGDEQSSNLFEMFDRTINLLLQAASQNG